MRIEFNICAPGDFLLGFHRMDWQTEQGPFSEFSIGLLLFKISFVYNIIKS
jgi:hypothetical protein